MNKKSLATVVILLTTALFASGQEESSPINTGYADLQMLSLNIGMQAGDLGIDDHVEWQQVTV